MAHLKDLMRQQPDRAPQLPVWLERIVAQGIVTSDPKIARRQKFTNVASYAAALNTGSRFLSDFFYDFDSFLLVQIYGATYLLWALLIPRLHRFGEYLATLGLTLWFLSGGTIVVLLFGLSSQVQVYFTISAIFILLYGVENWRIYAGLITFCFGLMMALLLLAPVDGIALGANHPLAGVLARHAMINTFIINLLVISYALLALQRAESDLERLHARTEALVSVMLPASIADRLRSGSETRIADRIDGLSVLFADIVGFTPAAREPPPEKVVAYLDDSVRTFETVCEQFGIEKIKTIGDAHLAVGGLYGNSREQAVAIGEAAVTLLERQSERAPLGHHKLMLRIGIHVGTAVAGVIGDMRIAYDLWGDAVNVASRMESHGVPGRIHVSKEYKKATDHAFQFEDRGPIDIKGIGTVRTFFLVGRRDEATVVR